MGDDEGFNCCGGQSQAGANQACDCIPQRIEERIIPCGSRKMAGQERQYRTTTSLWLSRFNFKKWSKRQGKEVDPVVWFTEMGHGPVPADVKL